MPLIHNQYPSATNSEESLVEFLSRERCWWGSETRCTYNATPISRDFEKLEFGMLFSVITKVHRIIKVVKLLQASEIGLPAPDLVLYLDIPAEVAAKRGGYGSERYEEVEFQEKVGRKFKCLQDSTWKILDATQPMDDVHSIIRGFADAAVESCRSGRELFEMSASSLKVSFSNKPKAPP